MRGELHVVVGAAGATGRRVVGHLVDAGHRVRTVTRDGREVGVPGAEAVAADATDVEAISRAAATAAAIHHCAMPPVRRWVPDFPVLTDSLVSAAGRSGARLVHADNTWMYGRVSAPMTVETPCGRSAGTGSCGPFSPSGSSGRPRPAGSGPRSCAPVNSTGRACAA